MSLLHAAVWFDTGETVRHLLERGTQVDCRDSQGMTPLMKACFFSYKTLRYKSPTSVFWLLEHGAQANALTPMGETPLILCTGEPLSDRCNRTDIAQVLLQYGADPNIPSPVGTTPLMFAARDNDVRLTHSLLRAGANPAQRTPDNRTALDIAMQRECKAVAAILRSTSVQRSGMLTASPE